MMTPFANNFRFVRALTPPNGIPERRRTFFGKAMSVHKKIRPLFSGRILYYNVISNATISYGYSVESSTMQSPSR